MIRFMFAKVFLTAALAGLHAKSELPKIWKNTGKFKLSSRSFDQKISNKSNKKKKKKRGTYISEKKAASGFCDWAIGVNRGSWNTNMETVVVIQEGGDGGLDQGYFERRGSEGKEGLKDLS